MMLYGIDIHVQLIKFAVLVSHIGVLLYTAYSERAGSRTLRSLVPILASSPVCYRGRNPHLISLPLSDFKRLVTSSRRREDYSVYDRAVCSGIFCLQGLFD